MAAEEEEEISDGELTDLLAEVDETAFTSSRLRPSTVSRPSSSTERRRSQRIQSRASGGPDPRPQTSWVSSAWQRESVSSVVYPPDRFQKVEMFSAVVCCKSEFQVGSFCLYKTCKDKYSMSLNSTVMAQQYYQNINTPSLSLSYIITTFEVSSHFFENLWWNLYLIRQNKKQIQQGVNKN